MLFSMASAQESTYIIVFYGSSPIKCILFYSSSPIKSWSSIAPTPIKHTVLYSSSPFFRHFSALRLEYIIFYGFSSRKYMLFYRSRPIIYVAF